MEAAVCEYLGAFKELIGLALLEQQTVEFTAHLDEQKAYQQRLINRRDLLLMQNHMLNSKEINRLSREIGRIELNIKQSEGFLLTTQHTVEMLSGKVYSHFKTDLSTHKALQALQSHYQTLLEMNEGLQEECKFWMNMYLQARQWQASPAEAAC